MYTKVFHHLKLWLMVIRMPPYTDIALGERREPNLSFHNRVKLWL
jgi:hypothetical protein